MKRIILLLSAALILPTAALAQIPKDPETSHFLYQGVVMLDSAKSDVLFSTAKEWLVRNLKSSDNNVNLNDKDSRSLTATGNIHLQDRAGWCAYKDINLNFKFSVFVKEGKYKYVVENFYYSYLKMCSQGMNSPVSGAFEELDFAEAKRDKVYEEADTKIRALISDLEKFVRSAGANSKKDDW